MIWKADDPEYLKISVLELCQEYYFHGRADGPICHRTTALRRAGDELRCAAVISMSDGRWRNILIHM